MKTKVTFILLLFSFSFFFYLPSLSGHYRQVHSNGSLFFSSFASHLYRTDIHDQIYRCQASNHAGTILSRNIHVRAIIHQSYDVKVEGHDVFLNNVAFLKCTVSSHIREFVEVTSWYRGDELLTDNSDISEYIFHLFLNILNPTYAIKDEK
jgi:hypothetical protein